MCKWSLVVTHTFLLMEFLCTEIIMEDWFFFSLMFDGNMSILFLSKYRTKNLVCMLLLLSEFPPSDLVLVLAMLCKSLRF